MKITTSVLFAALIGLALTASSTPYSGNPDTPEHRLEVCKNTGITILLQDQHGKPIPDATFRNQTKKTVQKFDGKGSLMITSGALDTTDSILISCVGYQSKSLSGKELLGINEISIILIPETLNEVTISAHPEELKFSDARRLPFPLFYHACVTDGEFAYTVGGYSETAISRQVLKYDPKTNLWSELTNKIEPVVQATASYVPSTGKIYVIGGLNKIRNFVYSEQVQTIDVKTGEVKQLKVKTPVPAAYSGSAVWNDKIYIFGGTPGMSSFVTGRATNAFFEFDPQTEKFTRLPDMPEAVQTTGAVVDGVLYVFGGYNASQRYNSNHIYTYNFEQKTWKMIGKMPSRNGANGICVYGPLIFMTGGYIDEDFSGYLDTRTQKFIMIKSNLGSRKFSGAVALYDHLMAIGGFSFNRGMQNTQVADLKELLSKVQ